MGGERSFAAGAKLRSTFRSADNERKAESSEVYPILLFANLQYKADQRKFAWIYIYHQKSFRFERYRSTSFFSHRLERWRGSDLLDFSLMLEGLAGTSDAGHCGNPMLRN